MNKGLRAAIPRSGACVPSPVLTHFYPECENADIEGQCRKTCSAGPLYLARDLMKIALCGEKVKI
ncbi:MAG: hypothetical protein ACLFUN_02830 [Desulfobacterales bacterium]